MPGKMASPEERMVRLKRIFSGQPAIPSKNAPLATENTVSNLLFAATLHAAARFGKGLPLSQLEDSLVKVLSSLAGKDEITAHGNMYSESKNGSLTQGHAAFPSAIFTLSENEPCTTEIIVKQIIESIPEIMDLPENKIVDVSTAETGEDGEIIVQGATEARFGIVYFTSSEKQRNVSSTTKCRMPLTTFKCVQESGEWGKDEIYWGFGVASDDKQRQHFKTREYGSMKTGKNQTFDSNTYYFNDTVQTHVAGLVECWEADGSTGDWYNSLQNFLDQVSTQCQDWLVNLKFDPSWAFDPEGIMQDVAMTALLWSLGALFSKLIDLFRNHDDLVKDLMIGWDLDGLRALTRRDLQETYIEFEGGGGGTYRLRMRCELS